VDACPENYENVPVSGGGYCNPIGGSESDPIITGFDGSKFDFKGAPHRVFNMLSIPDLQVSSYFIPGIMDNETYTGAVGIRQAGVNAILFDLRGAYYYAFNATGVKSIKITYPMNAPMQILNDGVITRPDIGELVIDWPLYSVRMRRMFEERDGIDGRTKYIDTHIVLRIASLNKDDIHGVIGQTYQRDKNAGYGAWETFAAPKNVADVFTDDFPAASYRYDAASDVVHTQGDAQNVGAHK